MCIKYLHLAHGLFSALWVAGVFAQVMQELLPDFKPLILTDTDPVAHVRLPTEMRPFVGVTIQMTLGQIDNPHDQGVMVCASLVWQHTPAAIEIGCIAMFPSSVGGQYTFALREDPDQIGVQKGASSLSLHLRPLDEHATLAPVRVHIDNLLWSRRDQDTVR